MMTAKKTQNHLATQSSKDIKVLFLQNQYNLIKMFSVNKNKSPSFEQSVYQNHRQLKNLQTQYYNNGYEEEMKKKHSQASMQQRQRAEELKEYNEKKSMLMNDLQISRAHKVEEKNYLAQQYEEMIKNRKSKETQHRNQQLKMDQDMLTHPTWIRDAHSERETHKQKINFYSHELDKHIKAQEERKKSQEKRQRQIRDKINREAEQILKKDYAEMEKRFLKKSNFQERQNALLGIGKKGIGEHSLPELRDHSYQNEMIDFRKRQKQVYEKGLQSQLKKESERKRKEISTDFYPPNHYNPITNPLPITYKNPNVLRMLGKK